MLMFRIAIFLNANIPSPEYSINFILFVFCIIFILHHFEWVQMWEHLKGMPFYNDTKQKWTKEITVN